MPRKGKSRTGTHPGLTRTRYFPRRLVTAADLTADQDYLRERLRRHNRYLHGCGIVCGLEVGAGLIQTPPAVTYGPDGEVIASSVALLPGVIVTPGYALSPQGDDIHVPDEQRLFLDHVLGQDGDCSRLDAPAPGPVRIWVAVRYREDAIDPIPALPERCAPTTRCEPSRFLDGFEVALLDVLPEGCSPLPGCEDLLAELQRREPIPGALSPGQLPQVPLAARCPPDAAGPWVVLAAIEISPGPAGPVFKVDYTPRARRIFSAALLGGILRCLPRRALGRPAQVARVEPANRSVFTLPIRPPRIAVVFDNDVVPATVTSLSMLVEAETAASGGARVEVGGAVSYDPALQATAVFTPSTQIDIARTYFIRVLGDGETVRDFEGQRLDGNADGTEGGNFQSSFKILPPPARVIAVFPPNGAAFPFPFTPSTVVFDKDIAPETVTNQNSTSGGSSIPSVVSDHPRIEPPC